MKMKRLSGAAALVVTLLSSQAHAQGAGRSGRTPNALGSVCVAPAPRPTAGEKSLSNPTGDNSVSAYSVQINDKPVTYASGSEGMLISGLSKGKKHLIKIGGDGEQVHSFRFRFSDYSSSRLCLWFNPFYETWSLWDAKDGGAKCRCGERSAK
jgi:hypothetical protein